MLVVKISFKSLFSTNQPPMQSLAVSLFISFFEKKEVSRRRSPMHLSVANIDQRAHKAHKLNIRFPFCDSLMDSIAPVAPVLPGKTEALRNMYKVLKKEKWNEFVKSEKRTGTEKERNFLQNTPMGDMVIVRLESKELKKTFEAFAASKDPFDIWLKEELKNHWDRLQPTLWSSS